MTISDYIECINKAFEAKFKDAKGWFICTKQYEKTPFPIYKKLKVTISYFQAGLDNQEVFSFSFQGKVPKDKEEFFEKDCLMEIITTVTFLIEKIWNYGSKV